MTTLGWKTVNWKGPKRPCAMCSRQIRGGVVNPANPEGNVLCHTCFRRIMGSPSAEVFEAANN